MTGIRIGVSAALENPDALLASINQMGQRIAQANKAQYDPVGKEGLATLAEYEKRLKQLAAVSESLRKRMKATGQQDASPLSLDFDAMYPNQAARNQQMLQFFKAVFGGGFKAAPPAPAHGGGGSGQGGGGGGTRPPAQPPGGGMGGAAFGAARGALAATGPMGGMASGAIGVGLSAGFGAGLVTLLGGLLQTGISKVMERVGQAEDNAVAMDRLKRILGDVNVSFTALESVVKSGAQNLRITYAETEKLATQFVKLSNVSDEQFKSLPEELEVGVGVSRAFGLDPSQGVGVMGQMRGLGVTKDTQESRRFALLIGETIGKAGAFAKADEVMESIAAFASSQTRQNMSAANVAGYAGMFSGMVSSGISGMDPQGAAGMLSRINATLSAGGGKGEASQFFTGIVGQRMGLDPIQTQILREGGAFATNDLMFGEGSAASRFGLPGPSGNETFLQASLAELRRQYGGNKSLLAQAASNHLGVGINQAMALLSVDPKQIGEMQARADLSKLSASGIGNMSKALYGSAGDRQALATSMLGRKDVSQTDKDAIAEAMKKDEATQREVLARLSAQYDQERTTGSDIRDSKNALDNIATSLASHLIPLTQEMRHGIMFLAGADKKLTPEQIMKDVVKRESEGRVQSIEGRFKAPLDKLDEEQSRLKIRERTLDPHNLRFTYRDNPEVLASKLKEREAIQAQIAKNEEEIGRLTKERADLLKKENERREAEMDRIKKDAEDRALAALEGKGTPTTAGGGGAPVRSGAPGGAARSHFTTGSEPTAGKGSKLDTSAIDAKLLAADEANGLPPGTMRSIMEQETGGKQKFLEDPSMYHYPLDAQGRRIAPHTGKVSTAFGPFGILESTASRPGYGVRPLKDKGIDEQIRFAGEYLGARVRSAGSLEAGLAGYGEGPAYSSSVMKRLARQRATASSPTIDGKAPAVGKVERGPDLPPVPAAAPADAGQQASSADPAKPRVQVPPASEASQADGGFRRVNYTPMPAAAVAREAAERSAVDARVQGEMSVRLELAPDAQRLLRPPAAPLSTRFNRANPFGTQSYL